MCLCVCFLFVCVCVWPRTIFFQTSYLLCHPLCSVCGHDIRRATVQFQFSTFYNREVLSRNSRPQSDTTFRFRQCVELKCQEWKINRFQIACAHTRTWYSKMDIYFGCCFSFYFHTKFWELNEIYTEITMMIIIKISSHWHSHTHTQKDNNN